MHTVNSWAWQTTNITGKRSELLNRHCMIGCWLSGGIYMSRSPTAIEEAERAGFDLSLVDESLSYTPEQRAVHHQNALDLALELERAGKEFRDKAQSAAPTPLRR